MPRFRLRPFGFVAGVGLAACLASAAEAGALGVVAAENFYGDVARQIGGAAVSVTSILENPNQDPHLFEASPSVARAVAAAKIVVYSGIDYDPWMEKLLAASPRERSVIVVAALIGRKTGDNPHIWYDPATMRLFAERFAAVLSDADPADKAEFAANLARFEGSLAPIEAKITALRARLAGTPVAATEPVFGEMFARLGMVVRDMAFQMAVMNDTEPAAKDVAAFENDLRQHRVRLLVYNAQASDPAAEKMEKIAHAAGVPVVGASETEPPGEDYQHWMGAELDAVDRALPASRP